MYKIQLTLTPQETQLLDSKARQLGYNVTKYIKLLIGKEVLNLVEKYPTFPLGQSATHKINQAHKEHKHGKTTRLNQIDDLDKI